MSFASSSAPTPARLLSALEAQLAAAGGSAPAPGSWAEMQLRMGLAQLQTLLRARPSEADERVRTARLEKLLAGSTSTLSPSAVRRPSRSPSTASALSLNAGSGAHSSQRSTRAYLLAGLSDSESEGSISDSEDERNGRATASTSLAQSPRAASASSLAPGQQTLKRKPSITITDMDRAPGHSRELDEDEVVGAEADEEERDEWAEYEAATAARRAAASSEPAPQEQTEEKPEKDDAMASDRAIHDSLTSELLRMAGVLKANSIAFGEALERDRRIIEQAGEKLEHNLDLMTRTRGRLGEYAKKARGLGWATLGAVLAVCMSWVFMFVLIKLT